MARCGAGTSRSRESEEGRAQAHEKGRAQRRRVHRREEACSAELLDQMVGFGSLAPKTKNLVVGGGLTGFVFGVYYYTMRAVGNTDELQVAIDKFEDLKKKDDAATPAANPSTPGSS
ncbi:hypothetical protein ZWY2020_002929 [Hordeum vulgare]|nr:hypothetical protein ZWY2020_002929 [Hordeum vulgare]